MEGSASGFRRIGRCGLLDDIKEKERAFRNAYDGRRASTTAPGGPVAPKRLSRLALSHPAGVAAAMSAMASPRRRAKGSDRASGGVDPFYTQTNTPENAVVVFARKARSTIGPGCRFLAPSLARDRGEVPRGGPAGPAHAPRNLVYLTVDDPSAHRHLHARGRGAGPVASLAPGARRRRGADRVVLSGSRQR